MHGLHPGARQHRQQLAGVPVGGGDQQGGVLLRPGFGQVAVGPLHQLRQVLPIVVGGQGGLLQLHPAHPGAPQGRDQLGVHRQQVLQPVQGVVAGRGGVLGLGQQQEGHGSDDGRAQGRGVGRGVGAGVDLALELLGARREGRLRADLRDQVVVVGVEPLGHLQGPARRIAAGQDEGGLPVQPPLRIGEVVEAGGHDPGGDDRVEHLVVEGEGGGDRGAAGQTQLPQPGDGAHPQGGDLAGQVRGVGIPGPVPLQGALELPAGPDPRVAQHGRGGEGAGGGPVGGQGGAVFGGLGGAVGGAHGGLLGIGSGVSGMGVVGVVGAVRRSRAAPPVGGSHREGLLIQGLGAGGQVPPGSLRRTASAQGRAGRRGWPGQVQDLQQLQGRGMFVEGVQVQSRGSGVQGGQGLLPGAGHPQPTPLRLALGGLQPVGEALVHRKSGQGADPLVAAQAGHREDPGHQRQPHPGLLGPGPQPDVVLRVLADLGDREVRPGPLLGQQHLDVVQGARGFGVAHGVGRDPHRQAPGAQVGAMLPLHLPDQLHEVAGERQLLRPGDVSGRAVPAQREDPAHPEVQDLRGQLPQLPAGAARGDHVGQRPVGGVVHQVLQQVQAAGASIGLHPGGHGDPVGGGRGEGVEGAQQGVLGGGSARWEQLVGQGRRRCRGCCGHVGPPSAGSADGSRGPVRPDPRAVSIGPGGSTVPVPLRVAAGGGCCGVVEPGLSAALDRYPSSEPAEAGRAKTGRGCDDATRR